MSYESLRHLPILNGVTLIGNKRFEDYGIIPMSSDEISEIILETFGHIL